MKNAPADYVEHPVTDLAPGWLFWFNFGRKPIASRITTVQTLPAGNVLLVHEKGRAEFSAGCKLWAKAGPPQP